MGATVYLLLGPGCGNGVPCLALVAAAAKQQLTRTSSRPKERSCCLCTSALPITPPRLTFDLNLFYLGLALLADGRRSTTEATSRPPWPSWAWLWTPEALCTLQVGAVVLEQYGYSTGPLPAPLSSAHGLPALCHAMCRRLQHFSGHKREGRARSGGPPNALHLQQRGLCLLPAQALVAPSGGAGWPASAGAAAGSTHRLLAGWQGGQWGRLKGGAAALVQEGPCIGLGVLFCCMPEPAGLLVKHPWLGAAACTQRHTLTHFPLSLPAAVRFRWLLRPVGPRCRGALGARAGVSGPIGTGAPVAMQACRAAAAARQRTAKADANTFIC